MPSHRPVALFTGGLAGDGVSRNTIHLANALARRGVPVEIVCLTGGALAADLRGPEVSCLGRRFGHRGLALAAAIPALRRRLADLRPAMVVSMGNHAHLPVWASLRGFPDLPRIYRISNDPSRLVQNPLRREVRDLGLRLIASDATRIVCVSAAIAGSAPFRRARRDGRVQVLPNGVDAAAVRARATVPAAHPWVEDGRPYIVAVGRLHRQKNYEGLIDALAIARRRGHPDLLLLVLGAAPSDRRAALEARARALGVTDAVRFEGEVSNPFPLVSRAAAYVLPSLWEGASNSLLEALACGVPVVASRTAGNAAQVLANGRYGALADPNDPADLARAMILQLDPSTAIPPGGRVTAFGLEGVVDRLTATILRTCAVHDEIQMQAEGAGHLAPLSDGLRGTNKEY